MCALPEHYKLLYLLSSLDLTRVLELTCSRYGFPVDGQLVNRSGQTPFHMLMAAQLTDNIVKVNYALYYSWYFMAANFEIFEAS